jgi:hypothetical protein
MKYTHRKTNKAKNVCLSFFSALTPSSLSTLPRPNILSVDNFIVFPAYHDENGNIADQQLSTNTKTAIWNEIEASRNTNPMRQLTKNEALSIAKQYNVSESTIRKIARKGPDPRPASHKRYSKKVIIELFMYIALNRFVMIPTLSQSSLALGLNGGQGFCRDVMYRFRNKYFTFKHTHHVPLLSETARILRERFAQMMMLRGDALNDRVQLIHVDEKSFIVGVRPKRVAVPKKCPELFEQLKHYPVLNKNKPQTCMVFVAVGRPLGENGERFDGRVAFIPVANENIAKRDSENKNKGDTYCFFRHIFLGLIRLFFLFSCC